MSQVLQYILVILVLLGAVGLYMAVSMSKAKRDKQKEGCNEDTSSCSTCTEACTLKREIMEKSKAKHLQQPK